MTMYVLAYNLVYDPDSLSWVRQTNGAITVNQGAPGAAWNTEVAGETLYTSTFDYDVNGNLIYSGKAAIGSGKDAAAWQIRKLIYVDSVLTDIQYADGDQLFNNIWNNRAALSYS
jgi:hypothetical protein